MKVQKEQRQRVFEAYSDGIASGQTMQEIANNLNKELGLDCEKTTYFKIYSSMAAANADKDLMSNEYLDEKIRHFADLDLANRRERVKLNIQRQAINPLLREEGEFELAKQTIIDIFKANGMDDIMTFIHDESVIAPKIIYRSESYPIYAYSDVHWGYDDKRKGIMYNIAAAKARLDYIFDWIYTDIVKNQYKKVDIADLADDIEGAALRQSQMLNIVDTMSEQAVGYANYIIQKLRVLTELLPDVEINFRHVSSDNHAELRLFNTQRKELPESLQPLITNTINVFVETSHADGLRRNLTYTTADEIILEIGNMNLLLSHGDSYSKKDDILNDATQRHETFIHAFISGHWHQFSVKNRNRLGNVQETLIFLPAVVGDTAYGKKSFYTGKPGFVKIDVYGDDGYLNARQVPIPV